MTIVSPPKGRFRNALNFISLAGYHGIEYTVDIQVEAAVQFRRHRIHQLLERDRIRFVILIFDAYF